MADKTKIEWTRSDDGTPGATWNPVTGCDEVSPGCDHCFERGFDVQLRPDKLDQPMKWRKPRRIFVNSMSDLFHKDVPDEYIAKVFAVMALTPQHTYQLLTKRHGRMRSLLSSEQDWREQLYEALSWAVGIDLPIPAERFTEARKWVYGSGSWPETVRPLPNVWLGVSVEDQKRADLRIPALLDTPAAVRFLSCEPLLGPVSLTNVVPSPRFPGAGFNCLDEDDTGEWSTDGQHWYPGTTIDWVIVGGESGRKARRMDADWARSLRDQCTDAGVPYFFKQWGAWVPGGQLAGQIPPEGEKFRLLDGHAWNQYPEVAA